MASAKLRRLLAARLRLERPLLLLLLLGSRLVRSDPSPAGGRG
jgi:hypothetical protein